MEESDVVDKIHELSNLELATLLCLIADQSCIITTDKDALDELEQELQLVVCSVFGLSSAVLHCSDNTKADDFVNTILVNDLASQRLANLQSGEAVNENSQTFPSEEFDHFKSLPRSRLSDTNLDGRKIPNVVIARDMNLASSAFQTQALDLIRSRRICSGTTVHKAPKPFLMIFLLSNSGPKLIKHLNDFIFLSHYHDPEDGFPNLEESSEWLDDDRASTSSVVHKSRLEKSGICHDVRVFSQADLSILISRTQAVSITAEVKRYLHNIVVFLRLHRAVAGGVSAQATKHFDLLVRCLAPMHSLTYVTPSLVALAARKVYPHRIYVTSPQNERSMQYGSELAAVTAMLEGITPELIIDEVLTAVEVPL
ncbi:hypothetical protein MMC16_002678 [Acarospora aff. strigata]|nr:hypothetical protein [Acarospora aff. strigata]